MTSPLALLPTRDEAVFSLKCFGSATLALYLAYAMGLPRPFWAMMTAYIVAQPWSGAVRSRAFYRLCGTFAGSAATIFLIPRLSHSPELTVLAMAGWVGLCLYVSLLDRTPRSYLFMLAGYTAALVGFPSVSDPFTVFDVGLARVEEISLGIVCAALVHSLVLPRGIAPAVMDRLDAIIRDAGAWITDTLAARAPADRDKARRTFASDLTQLRVMSMHVPYDTGNIRWTSRALHRMQDSLAALTPVVSAVEDRLAALRADGTPLPAPVAALLADIETWVAQGTHADPERAIALRARLRQQMPDVDSRSAWRDLLLTSLLARLHNLVDGYADSLRLRRRIQAGLEGLPTRHTRRGPGANQGLHRDHGLALLSGMAAVIAIVACCVFWIGTAWTNGATAATMAAIFSSFFAAQDNPTPSIMGFLRYTLYSVPLSALYLLGILPALHSFEMLALALFPTLFVLGVLIARPQHFGKAMPLLFGVLGSLALQDTNTSDLVSYLDITMAQVAGVGLAALVASLTRTVSADWAARRLQGANWRELSTLAAAADAPTGHGYALRMLDRVGLLLPRLAFTVRPDDAMPDDALRDLRIGREIVTLQRARRQLPMTRAALAPVLVTLARHFGDRSSARSLARHPRLLPDIDRALAAVGASTGSIPGRLRAAVALVGIRRGLYPDAPAYRHGQGPESASLETTP